MEMTRYASIFRRQVFLSLQEFKVISLCIDYTLSEVKILGHAGLDLKFMLDQEFFPDLTQCIIKYEGRTSKFLGKAILEDTFEIVKTVPTSDDESLIRVFGKILPFNVVDSIYISTYDYWRPL
ncbi:hypothetical protein AYI68_g4319 [Smittium mucronatum]|uniref:Uncharacterized protein n=1 Tax=Smittium mucronatum TaxID=133383 RepID=A0A1R0GXK5_9FUNG|nr:hypothetical protein AYI68_g4319 [Smittium mucronatum]